MMAEVLDLVGFLVSLGVSLGWFFVLGIFFLVYVLFWGSLCMLIEMF